MSSVYDWFIPQRPGGVMYGFDIGAPHGAQSHIWPQQFGRATRVLTAPPPPILEHHTPVALEHLQKLMEDAERKMVDACYVAYAPPHMITLAFRRIAAHIGLHKTIEQERRRRDVWGAPVYPRNYRE